jgi:hypothetical protein
MGAAMLRLSLLLLQLDIPVGVIPLSSVTMVYWVASQKGGTMLFNNAITPKCLKRQLCYGG